MTLFSRSNHSFFSKWWWNIDKSFLSMIITLSLVSLVLVIAASPAIALRIGLPNYYFVKHHIVFLIASLSTIVFFSNFSIPTNRRLAFLIFIGSLFLLFMTLFIGIEIKGARRWIHLPGFSLQPS